jgi:Domain of unknown function (DUF929)
MPGKPKRPSPAQQRVAARRAELAAAAARRQRRQRLTRVLAPVVAVLAVVAVLVAVKVFSGGSTIKSGQKTTAADSAVIKDVTTVPAAVLDTVGVGTVTTSPKAIKSDPLTQDGKPLVLYVGAEYCPYCATERWGVAVALSRFGTFKNLGQTTSSPSDIYPSTASLSFHGATFTSSTVAFTGKEIQSNQAVNGSYATLDKLTTAEQKTFSTYDAPPYVSSDSKGAIPFIDIGGKYMVSGASFSPQALQGKTHAQIAAALADPTSPIAKGVDGTANMVTAAICQSTSQLPAAVCQASGVQAATAKLSGAS